MKRILWCLFFAMVVLNTFAARQPNIILIMTDDQDYYDLGYHGNPDIDTPHLDQFASESLTMARFYVSPLCSPTRASLLTGRNHQRTGILHTSRGATRLAGDEITIAEILGKAGYRTGIFGKWHLGDNYPSRPEDHGFQESFYHKSGGISQPPDEEGTYWKPVIYQNGERKILDGYCTDLFFDAAIDFINRSDRRPFFVYIPTNVPHSPLHVDKEYFQPFLDKGEEEKTALIYGMLKNLDENIGRLLEGLDERNQAEDTLVIFMSDNGGVSKPGFQGDFRGNKGSIFEGGVRAPFFVRWPNGIDCPQSIDTIAAHVDVMPTLAAVAGAELPADRHLDGRDLLPLWKGKPDKDFDNRILYQQFNKAIDQAKYKCAAAISQRFKLIMNAEDAFNSSFVSDREQAKVELYDIEKDPGESQNLAARHPELVNKLIDGYEVWYASVKESRNMQPGRIVFDPAKENPVKLSRYQEAYHLFHDSQPEGWMMNFVKSGTYRLSFIDSKKYPFSLNKFWEKYDRATAIVKWKGEEQRFPLKQRSSFVDAQLAKGKGRLDLYLEITEKGQTEKVWQNDIGIEER